MYVTSFVTLLINYVLPHLLFLPPMLLLGSIGIGAMDEIILVLMSKWNKYY